MKLWTEARNKNKYMKSQCKFTYQLSFTKVDYHTGGKMVHPRPQTPQGESVAKPETPMLIILGIACKYHVHGNLFSPLFDKQSPWTKTS